MSAPRLGASLALLAALAAAKLQTGPVRLSGPRCWCCAGVGAVGPVVVRRALQGWRRRQSRWRYLGKFAYTTSTGNYAVRLHLRQPKNVASEGKVQLAAYIDDDWPRVEAIEDVCRRLTYSKRTVDLMIPAAGQWGAWANGTLEQAEGPHLWYFAVADCNRTLPNVTHHLRFELRGQQGDGSEFSMEQQGLLSGHTLAFAVLALFAWWFFRLVRRFGNSAGSVHPVIWILLTGVVLHCLSQFLRTVHLLVYRSNGAGIKALDVLSEILLTLSQVVTNSLVILVGLGYTLLQSSIGDLDLMIPVCFLVGVVQMMLVGVGKIMDDNSYKFHETEGALGWVLMFIRLALYLWFVLSVQSSLGECDGTRMRSFFQHYRSMGTIYFLAYNALYLGSKCVKPHQSLLVVSLGMTALQGASTFWLSTMFLTRGEYFKVSTLSASELPGGCKVGLVKEE